MGENPLRVVRHRLQLAQGPLLHRWMLRTSRPMALSGNSALVIAPHQDDETFGCGGMIALKRDRGIPVRVVFITDGRNSTPIDAHKSWQELAQTRRREALAATAILGVPPGDVHFLDQPDDRLRERGDEDRRTLISRLASLLEVARPQEVYVPHHADRHGDHEFTFQVAREAIGESGLNVRILEYPIWLIWWGPLRQFVFRRHLRGGSRLDVTAAVERKRRAIAVYASQLPTMPRGFIDQFRGGDEIYFEGDDPQLSAAARETPLVR